MGVDQVSRKSIRETRRRLYEAGNVRCPICLEPFTEAGVLDGSAVTLEHVPPPPGALGGRPICLTCKECNAGAGHGIDQAAVLLIRPPKATVRIMGRKETIHLHDALLDVGITLARSPLLCWSVKMRECIVLLPRGGDDSFYGSVEGLRQPVGTGSFRVTGHPTWNLLRFGFLPAPTFRSSALAMFRPKPKLETFFGESMTIETLDFSASGVCVDHQGRYATMLLTSADGPDAAVGAFHS